MVPLRYTRNLFLRSVCIVYLFAFISFYVQIPGLYGDNGILPARSLLENSKHKTLSAKVHYQPTLLWLAPYLGLDVNYAMDVLALLGSFLAFTGFVSQKFCTMPLFAGLWSLYFSLYQIGQVFVTNNYDDLLLEAGFLVLLVAPLLPGRRKPKGGSPNDEISFWLVRWLLFRFLFTSVVVKLLSGCPKWWNLQAFNHYYETMPLPSPLAWYYHHASEWHLKLHAVYTNVCEFGIPFLFFVPLRSVRITAFVLQMIFQIGIVLTGNYSFANLLLVTLMLTLLDDQFFYGRRKPTTRWNIVEKIINVVIYVAVLLAVIKLYSLKLNGTIIESNIDFTKAQFDDVAKNALRIVPLVGLGVLLVTILRAFLHVFDAQGSKIFIGLSVLVTATAAVIVYIATTVPLASIHPSSNSSIYPAARTISNRLQKLHAVNQYGFFSKTVQERFEIILEGSDSLEGPWLEYSFLYKPANVNHSLPFVAPYSPRLDWQLYWAAQSTYDQQPWILSFAHRILSGKTEVLTLLDRQHSPFGGQKAPKYLRALLYKYKYTAWAQRAHPSWWARQKVGEYFPPYTKDSPALVDYLKARNLLPAAGKSSVNAVWKQILDAVRYVASHLEATLLLWSVFTAGCAIITTSAKK